MKKNTSIMRRLARKPFTEEEKADIKKRHEEHLEKLTLSYQLGFHAGEYIILHYLPTLSVDSIQTQNNISVTAGEGDACRKLSDKWFDLTGNPENKDISEKAWLELREYHKTLEEKYIPKTLKCMVGPLYLKKAEMSEFKEGVIDSLWDCDCCYYSLKPEDIEFVFHEDIESVEIILKK